MYDKQHYIKYRASVLRASKKWRLNNPEKVKKHREREYAKKREATKLHRLQNPRIYKSWEKIRKSVLKRDNFSCRNCEGQATEVHHKDGSGSNKFVKDQNNSIYNLISVCHRCNIMLDLELQGSFNKGRWIEDKERNKKILESSFLKSQANIARELGITRQRVNQIIKRLDKGKDLSI